MSVVTKDTVVAMNNNQQLLSATTGRVELPFIRATAIILPTTREEEVSERVIEQLAPTDKPAELAFRSHFDLVDYQRDVFVRTILFFDVLRRRANNMLAHEFAGLPPLLNFKYETLPPPSGRPSVKIETLSRNVCSRTYADNDVAIQSYWRAT